MSSLQHFKGIHYNVLGTYCSLIFCAKIMEIFQYVINDDLYTISIVYTWRIYLYGMKYLFILNCPFSHVFTYAILRTFFVLIPYFSLQNKYRLKECWRLERNLEGKLKAIRKSWGSTFSMLSMSSYIRGHSSISKFLLLRLILYFLSM